MTRRAILTIDDGPDDTMPEKLSILEERGIRAVWFCLGQNLEREDAVLRAIRTGHIIANHGYDHTAFSHLSIEEARRQIEQTDQLISALYDRAGIAQNHRFFRFPYLDNGDGSPYGETKWDDPHVRSIQQVLRELGYSQHGFEGITYAWYRRAGFDRCANIDCTYDSHDYCIGTGTEVHGCHDLPSVLARIEEDEPEEGRGLTNGTSDEIIMMHSWIPDDAFKAIIDSILTKNIAFTIP
ncbi:MAG: polysaccharide deacetylase family protein [Candidatus Woesearchaeota archaeon]